MPNPLFNNRMTNEMCALLGLDVKDACNESKIKTAYKKLALIHHPDKVPAEQKIEAQKLFIKIKEANDYLIEHLEANSAEPPEAPSSESESHPFLITLLKSIKAGTSTLSRDIPWISYLINSYLTLFLMTTHSNGQLNFRYVNDFSELLKSTNLPLNKLDRRQIIAFLSVLKSCLKLNDPKHIEILRDQEMPFIDSKQELDAFIKEIKNTRKELKELLTDDFLMDLTTILKFIPQFVESGPSWWQILGVYFISLLVTSTSLPKFLNAIGVTLEVILKQKGDLAWIGSLVPMAILAAALLPLNIALQLGVQLSLISLKALLFTMIRAMYLIYATAAALIAFDCSLPKSAPIIEHAVNLVLRTLSTAVLESLNAALFILTDHDYLSSVISDVNQAIDNLIDSINPQSTHKSRYKEPQRSKYSTGFFAKPDQPIQCDEDIWLNELLTKPWSKSHSI